MYQIYSGIDKKSKQIKNHVRNGENYYTCSTQSNAQSSMKLGHLLRNSSDIGSLNISGAQRIYTRHKMQNNKQKATNIKHKAINQMLLKSNKSRKTEWKS